MYSTELIKIFSDIPSISHINFTNIDNFIGEVGEKQIFKKTEMLRILTQKNLVDDILIFMVKENIVEPYKQKCPNCAKELIYKSTNCSYCSNEIIPDETISYYKIISKLNLSYTEKKSKNSKKIDLDFSSFKLLLKKIDRKIRNSEEGFLFFIDIANSTRLAGDNKYLSAFVCKGLLTYIKELIRPFFLRSSGILVKSEGDSSYLYFENEKDIVSFTKDFNNGLKYQDFYNKMIDFNEQHDYKIYFKTYTASSPILDYHQTDMLSIDFTSMEAFVFINRIEKKAKSYLLKKFNEEELFPLFIISRNKLFNGKQIILDQIEDYKTAECYYSTNKDLE